MEYTKFQAIILIKNSLNITERKKVVEDIENFIKRYTRKIKILDKNARQLAYKVEDYDNAWFIAIEFILKTVGARKRVKMIKEKLNTIAEILSYKIIEKDRKEMEKSDNTIYIVYEFDYGDISNKIEPRVTHFGGFNTRAKAVVKANELLNEGLEKYFIQNYLTDNNNPFEDNDEVHLYEQETEDKQNESVYYIKIKKINIE